jgi:ADP-ribose pyrophosphatase
VVEEHTATARCDEGFLRLRRLTLRNRYPDGTASAAYRYDMVERDALDAVAIVLHADGPSGPTICLRTALRPPLAFRRPEMVPIADPAPRTALWEVPAGLVEPGERGETGLRACASRETLEEVGLHVAPERFVRLGPEATLSPGVIGEKIWYLAAEVVPAERGTPTEDGSPVEERAVVRFVPVREALAATRDGRIADVKTEVAVHRLAALRGVR